MIFIDSNEEATTEIPKHLKEMGVSTAIVSQHFDYIVTNKTKSIAVERKEASDYIQSKQSGHLDKQLYEYSTNFELSYLIIIGNIQNHLINHNLSRTMYISSLIGSSLKTSPDGKQGQIVTVNLDTDYDFELFLKLLDSKVEEGNFTRLPKFERAKMTDEDYAIHILTSFPNVGQKRAEEILHVHGNLQNAFSTLIYQHESFNVKGITQEMRSHFHQILIGNNGEQK